MKDLQNTEKKPISEKTGTEDNTLLNQITEYAQAHLAEKVSLKALSQQFGVSVSTITQTFQRKAGMSFHRYLTQQRMKQAVELIRTGTPLEEAGRLVGYTDHSSFYRAFKQIQGCSPREYRKASLQK